MRNNKESRKKYVVDNYNTPRQAKEAGLESKRSVKRIAKKVFGFYVRCFFIALVLSFLVSFFATYPEFAVKDVIIKGDVYSNHRSIVRVTNGMLEKNIIFLDKHSIEKRLLKNKEIKIVKISRKLPCDVVINITERKPFAMIKSDLSVSLIDDDYFVFHKLSETDETPKVPTIISDYKVKIGKTVKELFDYNIAKMDQDKKDEIKKVSDADEEAINLISNNYENKKNVETQEYYNLAFCLNIVHMAKNKRLNVKEVIVKDKYSAMLKMSNDGPIVEFGALADVESKMTALSDIYKSMPDINKEAREIYLINAKAATFKRKPEYSGQPIKGNDILPEIE